MQENGNKFDEKMRRRFIRKKKEQAVMFVLQKRYIGKRTVNRLVFGLIGYAVDIG